MGNIRRKIDKVPTQITNRLFCIICILGQGGQCIVVGERETEEKKGDRKPNKSYDNTPGGCKKKQSPIPEDIALPPGDLSN